MPIIGAFYIKETAGKNADRPFFLKDFKIESPENEIIYSIPIPKYKYYTSLSLGVVSPPPSVSCDNISLEKNSVGASQFEKNTNTIITLPSGLNCSNLNISFKKQKGYPTFGQISGMAIFSDTQTAIGYKRIVDFFGRDIRIFLLIIVLLYIYFYSYEKIINSKKIAQDFIERHSISWGLFLISSSGIIETILPQVNSGILSQINSYFSAVAHLAPGIDLILINYFGSKQKRLPLYAYYIGFSYILISPERIYAMALIGIPIGVIALFSSILKRSEIKYSFYAALLLVNFLKLIGWYSPEFLPHIHLVSIYVGALMFQSTLLRIQLVGKITSSVFWQNSTAKDNNANDEQVVTQILNKLIEMGDFKRVSYLKINEKSSPIRMFTFTRNNQKRISCDKIVFELLPPVFAAVVASGEPIWHEHSESDRSIRLKRNTTEGQSAGHYCIVPLKQDSRIVGAIAITGYKLDDDVKMEEFYKKIILSFSSHLEKSLENLCRRNKLTSHQGLNDAKNELVRFLGFSSHPESLSFALEALSKSMASGFILFSKNIENSYKSIFSTGLEGSIKSIANSLTVEKDDLNEHGPFPLSIRNKRAVFINQTSLLHDVLSKRTVDFFTRAKTKSLSVLPILSISDGQNGEEVNFVIMMVNETENFFTSDVQDLLSAFIVAVEQKDRFIEVTDLVKSQTQTLASFVPQEVVAALMDGNSTRLESSGFLGCLDIIGSTRYLNHFGDKAFLEKMHIFTESTKSILKNTGAQIYATNWDAIYIHADNLEDFIAIYSELHQVALSVFTCEEIETVSTRLCLTYGNTSRDFSEAEGFRRWTIVGNAMPDVCKFEQSVKNYGEGLYINEIAYANISAKSSSLKYLNKISNETGTSIYMFNFSIYPNRKTA